MSHINCSLYDKTSVMKNIAFDENIGELAPNRVQNLLNDKDFLNAINKGLKILGE
jgi:hypothetical protein